MKGEPLAYLRGHNTRNPDWNERLTEDGPNVSGLCQCGCGETTPVARQAIPKLSIAKGQHHRFVHGHNRKMFAPGYFVEDFVRPGVETPCWRWTGRTDENGYGRLSRNELAHVHEWRKARGSIPKGIVLHHRCEFPACVNPEHLDPETRATHRARHGKITPALAEAVRAAQGPQRDIGRRFGLSQGAVSKIKRGYDGPS